MKLEDAKARMCDEVDKRAAALLEVSHQIHEHPELAYEEHFAHDLLTSVLDDEELSPERGAFGLPTGFAARAGSQGPLIAVLCEYDALPEIGHACGHNIIAAAGLGAGLAAATLADELGGRVIVLGTPAEEGGGGKILMAEKGAFDGVDAAMMVHPAGADLCTMNTIAVQQIWVEYHGVAAHAAAFPYKGKNALDGAVLGYMNVAALRQHIRPDERIHGVFTHGGDKPNIVPKFAAAQWYVRAANLQRLDPLKARVLACLQAGADAAGCELRFEWKEPAYADLLNNEPYMHLYSDNAGVLGRDVLDPRDVEVRVVGSTDMGNVSYLVPSIHPMIKVSPPHISIHTPEFAGYARADEGDRAVIDGAKAMAMTVADLWLQPDALQAVQHAFGGASSP